MCSLPPWSNCCSVQKIGIFAEEGPQNHPLHCTWYAVWFCMCIHWIESISAWRYELRRFFAQLRIRMVVYMTFPNDETQILFLGFNDTPFILYHGQELINIDLLSTLPWLNITNFKDKYTYNTTYPSWLMHFELYADTNRTEALCMDTGLYCVFCRSLHTCITAVACTSFYLCICFIRSDIVLIKLELFRSVDYTTGCPTTCIVLTDAEHNILRHDLCNTLTLRW